MENLLRNLRHTLRGLVRKPVFAAMVIVTLGIAIGATTAVLSVANAVLFCPLPYEQPERLVFVWDRFTKTGVEKSPVASPDFLDFQKAQLFEGFAAAFGTGTNLTGDGKAESIQLGWASPNLFSVLGVELLFGEMYGPEDEGRADPSILSDANATPPPAPLILSYGLWQRRYGGNRDVLGRTIEVNGQSMIITGVAPKGFKLLLPADAGMPKRIDAWSPFPLALASGTRDTPWLTVVARLKPGVSREEAEAEMATIAAYQRENFEFHKNVGTEIVVLPMHEEVVGNVRPTLLTLLGAAAFLLLIACANAAILLLLRSSDREKEFTIRSALGGSRGSLVSQMLIESAVLAVLAAGVGLVLARSGIQLLLALEPDQLPRVETVGLDGTVLGVVLATTAVVALLCGLAPTIHLAGSDLAAVLSERRSGGRPGGHRLRKALVVAEVAISLILLIGAGLMLRSFLQLQRVNPGFQPDKILTAKLSLPFFKYVLPSQRADFFHELSQRVAALPGVESVGGVNPLPLAGGGQFWFGPYATEGEVEEWNKHEADYRQALPGYLRTMKTRLLEGRLFTAADDTVGARPVTIVDEIMARRAWPGESALGKQLMVAQFDDSQTSLIQTWTEVVGVVEHIRHDDLSRDGRETIYFPQRFWSFSELTLTIATKAEPLDLVGPLRQEVEAMDSDLPLVAVRTMQDYVDDALAPSRFTFLLIAVFAGIATVLATVGLYGVISYSVKQRSYEIGVRLAFGAQPRDILGLVIGQAMLLASIGVVLGLIAAFFLTEALSSLLYEITPTDPLTFTTLSLLLLLAGFAAASLPAKRATRVDPVAALQAE